MKIIIIIGVIIVFIFFLLRLFIKSSAKGLAKDMTRYVDLIKLTLYKIFSDKFMIDYSEKGKDFSGAMAATIVNEFFDCHNEKTKSFLTYAKKISLNCFFHIKHLLL